MNRLIKEVEKIQHIDKRTQSLWIVNFEEVEKKRLEEDVKHFCIGRGYYPFDVKSSYAEDEMYDSIDFRATCNVIYVGKRKVLDTANCQRLVDSISEQLNSNTIKVEGENIC